MRLGLDLTVVIVNDGGYGMIKWKQASLRFPDFGLDFNNPDFVKYAESYGAKGFRISSAQEFSEVLKKCVNSGGVHLIDCPIDYSENTRVFTEDLPQRTSRMD